MNTFPRKEALGFGWNVAKKNIRFFVPVLLTVMGVSFFFSVIDSALGEDAVFARFIVGIASWVVSSITAIGLIRICLDFVDNKKANISDLFKYYDRTVNYMAGSILYGLIVGLGLLLLIVPGIYFGLRLQFFSYLAAEKNMGPIQSLRNSWDMTRGMTWQLFVYGLLVMGINILGFLALFVGLFWTIPTTSVTTAYIYRHLAKK